MRDREFQARVIRRVARWCVVLLALCFVGAAGAESAVDARPHAVNLEPHWTLLRDARGELDEAGARQALSAGRFQPLPRGRAQFGFVTAAIWLHVSLDNPGATAIERTLVLGHPRLDELTVFVTAPEQRRIVELGDHATANARAHPLRDPNLDLRIDAGQRLDVLVRVDSSSSIQVPAMLYDARTLDHRLWRSLAIDMFFYGLLLGLLLYNLALYFGLGDRTYLWYVGYVASFGALILIYSGRGLQWFWPGEAAIADLSVPMSTGVALAMSTSFQRAFLDLRRNAPAFDPWFKYIALGMAALALITPLASVRASTVIANAAAMLASILAYVAAVRCWLAGYKPARYFVLAWSVLILGGVFVPLKNFGWIDTSVLTEYGIQIGSAIEMVLLSFAMAYRINMLRLENERLMSDARQSLEQRVDERTQELHMALAELEIANRHLRESSRRDGLTGVYNRRHLDDVLDGMTRRAQAHGLPLSVLMLDLDHFKQINDRHGHAAGDDCLRAIAARIAAMVDERPDAFVARYGGEEFVVVLPMSDGNVASELAERLRQNVARMPVATLAGDVPMTLSVGIATLTARDVGSAALLARADQALYEAKHHGRDRVVANGG